MPRRRALALLLVLAAGPARGQTQARGVEAVRAALARQGRVPITAELARRGEQALTPAALSAARERLARALAPHGVPAVRPLGELPFVALEVDGRQFDALLATGEIAAVALRGAAKPD